MKKTPLHIFFQGFRCLIDLTLSAENHLGKKMGGLDAKKKAGKR